MTLQDFRIALSAKLRKALRVDFIPAHVEHDVFDWLDIMIGPLYMAFSGLFWKIDAEHVIQLVCYNISLYLVSAVFTVLFICTLIFEELDITSISVMFNFSMVSLMILFFHMELFFHRFEIIGITNQIINWIELKRRPKSLTLFETFSFKFVRVYWAPLVWTTWGCFMVSIPLYDYFSNGRAYSLPFPLWFPFKTNDPLGYAAAYLFEIYAVHFFSSFVVSTVPMVFVICYKILSEYNYMIDSIRSLHEDALAMYKLQLGERTNVSTDPRTDEEYFDLYNDRVFQYCCELCLRQINIQHSQISRAIKDVNRSISLPVTISLTVAYLVVGAALCLVFIDIGDITLKVTFTAIGIMDLFLSWFICHLSQMLIIKGENIREELYFTNWYHWPEVMKRSLRLMLVRSLYPPNLSAAYFDIKADYITFAAVVNSTYSFINLVYAFTH